jgi:hypothetical protein
MQRANLQSKFDDFCVNASTQVGGGFGVGANVRGSYVAL